MHQATVFIGVGKMGGVFARGFLRCGYPVYPITRYMNIATAAHQIPDPILVLVAVAEKDLVEVLAAIPRERLLADLEKAIHADPNHKCIGRSAPARCERAIQMSDKAGLAVPAIRKIYESINI